MMFNKPLYNFHYCEDCGCRMEFEPKFSCFICRLCGQTNKSKSDVENPSYVG